MKKMIVVFLAVCVVAVIVLLAVKGKKKKETLRDIVKNRKQEMIVLKQDVFVGLSDKQKIEALQVYAECVCRYMNIPQMKVTVAELKEGIYGYTDGTALFINRDTLKDSFRSMYTICRDIRISVMMRDAEYKEDADIYREYHGTIRDMSHDEFISAYLKYKELNMTMEKEADAFAQDETRIIYKMMILEWK